MVGLTSFEKGIITGQRTALQRLLDRKFGPLTVAVEERLAALPPERVAELLDAILTATSLAELGLENGK